MRYIGKRNLVVNTKKVEVMMYSISEEDVKYNNYPINTIARAGVDMSGNRVVYLCPLFFKLSKGSALIILEHEIAHSIGETDEVEADKRAIFIYGKNRFKKAVRESYELMRKYSTNTYSDYEFINLIRDRIRLATN